MRRVESVIDTWYDSGAMPFAQFHYPFENEAEFEERFPADYICEAQDQTRGWFYTLLAESTLLFGESSYRNCVCLGLILDPEGQKMSKSRGNVVDPWEVISRPRRRRLPLVLPDRPAALGRLPLLGRHGRRIGAPVPAHPLEHVLLLGPLRQRRGPRPTRLPRRPRAGQRPRPLGALAPAGDDRDGARAHGRVRLHRRRPRDRRVRRGALQLVRAALAPALLGRRPRRLRDPAPLPAGDGGAARSLRPLPRRRDPPQPRRRRARRRPASSTTRSTCATTPRSTRRSPTRTWRPGWRRSASRSNSAAPPAPRPRPRCASRCAAP